MELTEAAQEILETLWTKLKEAEVSEITFADIQCSPEDPPISELREHNLIRTSGNVLQLTTQGEEESKNAIRRHRLAERLLIDVLNAKHQLLEENACRFEHLLYPGMEETICTLLGHPKTCPHGHPIPPGECCDQTSDVDQRLVSSLIDMRPDELGKIAYLQSRQSKEIQKLMAIGILPGSSIQLIRRFPSYVFQVGNTQYAVDKSIAAAIYVRLERNENTHDPDNTTPGRRRRRGRRG